MESFDDIKVGDKVVIRPPGIFPSRSLATVDAVTRTQFAVGGYRFRKKDGGYITKDRWYHAFVYRLTPELLAEVAAERRYNNAHNNLVKLRNQLETVTREIDRTRNKHQMADAMEAAAADVAAAVAKLREAIP